jgi:hypothetical protein
MDMFECITGVAWNGSHIEQIGTPPSINLLLGYECVVEST